MFKHFLALVWPVFPEWLRDRLMWLGTPKYTVNLNAFCLNERNEILLLEHRFHNGLWDVPGGALTHGEQLADGLMREVWEETRLLPTDIAMLYVEARYSRVEVFFVCFVGDALPILDNLEIVNYRWVDPQHAAPLSNQMSTTAMGMLIKHLSA